MKIALVTDAIYPYHNGGKEKRTYEVSTRLTKRGHEVHVYCMNWWQGEPIRKEHGVYLHGISKYYPLYSKNKRSIKQGLLYGISTLKLLGEDFDVIEVDHMPYFPLFFTKIVCILKRKKLIGVWNEVWGRDYWVKYLGWKGNLAYVLEKMTVYMPDQIISISDHTSRRLRSILNYKKEIKTIPLGVDFQYIQKIKPASQKSDVIFAGRLLHHKNVDFLLRTIYLLKKKHKDIKCFIIGDGPERKRLYNIAEKFKLKNHIEFLGFLDTHDKVYSLMKSSKVFAFPSVREGFGFVTIEANACGLPVVAIDHPDNAAKDLITEKTGIISQLNEKAFASHLDTLLTSKRDKQAFYNFAHKFDWQHLITHLEHAYTL